MKKLICTLGIIFGVAQVLAMPDSSDIDSTDGPKCKKRKYEIIPDSEDNSSMSDMEETPANSYDQWIESHASLSELACDTSMCSLSDEEKELADRACYSHTDIVQLLAHLRALDYHEARDKYKLILDRWNDNNTYELVDTGSSFIGCCERNYYDF